MKSKNLSVENNAFIEAGVNWFKPVSELNGQSIYIYIYI
jgi:hypothetical protein